MAGIARLLVLVCLGTPILWAGELPTLYPFIRDGKWGYIDGSGKWVIEPRFERCLALFEEERVPVSESKRWGGIDRAGEWVVKPQFTSLPLASNHPFEVVSLDKKQGILEHSGKVLLAPKYDAVVLSGDRAWVRDGKRLGIFSFSGKWLLKLSLPWPESQEMPILIDGDSGAAWFKEGRKWGLLSRDGKVLFPARFAEHELGRHEAEDWDHPEGVDFHNGRAWVVVGKEYWLITAEGKVLSRQRFKSIRPWTKELDLFVSDEGKQGLISKEGTIVLPARFSAIQNPTEGMATVGEQKSRKNAEGQTDVWWIYGYINEHGKMIVEPGAYVGPGMGSGGQVALAPFSEGLAPVWASPPGDRWDPYAGYIDRTGAIAIPLQFLRTTSFSNGLAAVQDAGRRSGLSPSDGLWGYVDRTGAMVIPPAFKLATPFSRDRAWVLKPGSDWNRPEYAMIDRTGKVLTDYAYDLPEHRTTWIGGEFFGDKNSRGTYSEADYLRIVRWRGNLAVISKGDFLNGLATADGKVLVEPVFNQINEFHDGVAVAMDSRGRDDKGNVTFATALISERGEVIAYNKYTTVSDFNGGVAWATHRWTDHRGPYKDEGWGLIDPQAREITECRYVKPGWIWSKSEKYSDNRCPEFYGDLAPVALAEGYQPYGDTVWLQNSWGYVDRTGKVVAWYERPAPK